MLRSIDLLLPALVPSWRFFQRVEPSPRIEFRLTGDHTMVPDWAPFRPRPQTVSVWAMFARMIWNPGWNEKLYLTSCAERLICDGREHARHEILRRIKSDFPEADSGDVQFRLVVISREGERLQKEIAYTSTQPPHDTP